MLGILTGAGFSALSRGAYYIMTDISEFDFPDDVSLRKILWRRWRRGRARLQFLRRPQDGPRQIRFTFCKKESTLAVARRSCRSSVLPSSCLGAGRGPVSKPASIASEIRVIGTWPFLVTCFLVLTRSRSYYSGDSNLGLRFCLCQRPSAFRVDAPCRRVGAPNPHALSLGHTFRQKGLVSSAPSRAYRSVEFVHA